MTKEASGNMFRFRKAEASDKERICEISSTIWEGTDYIPSVFDEWVSDKAGEFTVAEYRGEIAGFAKYSRLVHNEAWLEGIRADRNISGKGFGEAITRYFINKAKAEGLNVLRLSTFIENNSSICILERCGFKRDAYFSYCSKKLNAKANSVSNVNVVKIMSTATAWSFIENSRFYMLSNGFISLGWHFYKLTYELLDSLVKAGKVVGTIKNGTITAMAIIMGDKDKDTEIGIGFVDGEASDKCELLDYIENSTAAGVVKSIEFMSVVDRELIEILIDRDYRFEYHTPFQANVYVYIYNIK